MTRSIQRKYQDPVELIWLHAAQQCGMRVVRDPQVFASWDGQGILRLGTPETLDADDSLAQMILHELCHALVAGPQGQTTEDWGLQYDRADDRVFEQATLRLQAALTDPFQLRQFFASTTDFRDYFDRLPQDTLRDERDPAAMLAAEALHRDCNQAWIKVIRQALTRTATIAKATRDVADNLSLWQADLTVSGNRQELTKLAATHKPDK